MGWREGLSFESEAEDRSGTPVPLEILYCQSQVSTGTYVAIKWSDIYHYQASAIICHGNLHTGLEYMPVQASVHITSIGDVSTPPFVHRGPGRQCLWGHVQRNKTKQEWLGPGVSQPCHSGAEWCLSVCLLAWLKSYFIFLWDYQEWVAHGRGTWQRLNLFLLQAQLNFSPSVFCGHE